MKTVGDVARRLETLEMHKMALDLVLNQIRAQADPIRPDGPWVCFGADDVKFVLHLLEDGKRAILREVKELEALKLAGGGKRRK